MFHARRDAEEETVLSIDLTVFIFLALCYSLVVLWAWRGIGKLGATKSGGYQPSVSIVVAARNEEERLPALLVSLQLIVYPTELLEIIVVDDGSTDGTWQLLENAKSDLPHLQVIHIAEPPLGWSPKKWGLSKAIELATGELILATDADCEPTPDWVDLLIQPFVDKNVAMVMGPAPLTHASKGWWWSALRLDSNAQDALAAGSLAQGVALTCTGRNIGYRRELFHKVGGYEGVEHFVSGDDDLLMHRLASLTDYRLEFVLSPDVAVKSPPPLTFKSFVLQRLRFASKGTAYYGLPTSTKFRLILPLVYLANVAVLASSVIFILGGSIFYLVPYSIKFVAEWILIHAYNQRIREPLPLVIYLLTSFAHPIYVVVIGALANLLPVRWKGREFQGNSAGGQA